MNRDITLTLADLPPDQPYEKGKWAIDRFSDGRRRLLHVCEDGSWTYYPLPPVLSRLIDDECEASVGSKLHELRCILGVL